MTATLLDGKAVAMHLKQTLCHELAKRQQALTSLPCLAVILVGTDEASAVYVKNKRKACEEMGIRSLAYDLPSNTSEQKLLSLIDELNQRQDVNGILVQLPLPEHMDSNLVIERIHPFKDVDGFHPYNMGRLAQGNPLLRPCTPYGIMQLLNYYKIETTGKNAVVIGASNIVGRPMALELLYAKSTVTVCHSATKDLEEHVRRAEILIIAAGVPDLVKPEWLNRSQVLVDVGIHRKKDGNLRGDLDFNRCKNLVAYISPVPGGVGPMTVFSLLKNTLEAANLQKI